MLKCACVAIPSRQLADARAEPVISCVALCPCLKEQRRIAFSVRLCYIKHSLSMSGLIYCAICSFRLMD